MIPTKSLFATRYIKISLCSSQKNVCLRAKKLLLAVPLHDAPFEMGLLCRSDNDVIECITFPDEFRVISDVRATRTGLLGHTCYVLWSKHSKTVLPQMLPHQILMRLQQSEGNPGGITTEMRRDSMTFGRFQRPDLNVQ
jgi:hypothetical protein